MDNIYFKHTLFTELKSGLPKTITPYRYSASTTNVTNIIKKCLDISLYFTFKYRSQHLLYVRYAPYLGMGLILFSYLCQLQTHKNNPDLSPFYRQLRMGAVVAFSLMATLTFTMLSTTPLIAALINLAVMLINIIFDGWSAYQSYQELNGIKSPKSLNPPQDQISKEIIKLSIQQNQYRKKLEELIKDVLSNLHTMKKHNCLQRVNQQLRLMYGTHLELAKLQHTTDFDQYLYQESERDLGLNLASVIVGCFNFAILCGCLLLFDSLATGLATVLILTFMIDLADLLQNTLNLLHFEHKTKIKTQNFQNQSDIYLKQTFLYFSSSEQPQDQNDDSITDTFNSSLLIL